MGHVRHLNWVTPCWYFETNFLCQSVLSSLLFTFCQFYINQVLLKYHKPTDQAINLKLFVTICIHNHACSWQWFRQIHCRSKAQKVCVQIIYWSKLQWGTKVLTHFRKRAPFCIVDILIPFPCLPQPLPPKINVEFWTLKSFFYFRQHWFGGWGIYGV